MITLIKTIDKYIKGESIEAMVSQQLYLKIFYFS